MSVLPDVEATADALLQALGELRSQFARAPLSVRDQLPPNTRSESLFGVDLTIDANREWSLSAYLDYGIDGVPNVWWLRVSRDADRKWLIERWVEIYRAPQEEEVTTAFEPVRIADAAAFAQALPQLVRELLAVPPPSLRS